MSDIIQQIETMTTRAVRDVFQNMLAIELTVEAPAPLPTDSEGQIIGSVGFLGDATGIIYLHSGVEFARVITSRMLGIEQAEIENDGMVNDAFGELSNMVVGFVKSRLCDSGRPCVLTIPSVVRGQRLSITGTPNVTKRIIGFRYDGHCLVAEVLLKETGE